MTLLGVIAPQVKLAGTVSVSVTVPEKPLALTVIVQVTEAPAGTAAGQVKVTVSETVANVKVAVAECDRVPLVPVIGSEKVPAVVELQDTVAVPDPVTVPGVIAPQVSPEGTVSVSVTTPVNPLTAAIVMVEDAAVFTVVLGDVAVIVKSVTVNVAVVEWDNVPLVPVIVSV